MEEPALEAEAAPAHIPAMEADAGIEVEIPEAEVLEEELEPAFEVPEALEDEEAEEAPQQPAFEVPEALEVE